MILCLLFKCVLRSKTLTGENAESLSPYAEKKIAVGKKFVCRVCSTGMKSVWGLPEIVFKY